MPNETQPHLNVNGKTLTLDDAWLGESLLYTLRERLGLYGSKNACEQGECGSCSIMLDETLVCACLVLTGSATGKDIKTIESLAPEGSLSTIQQAFVDTGAIQCGFCTPGLLITIKDFLDENTNPTDLEIREAISGNLCRCTGYGRIVEAVRIASKTHDETEGATDDNN
tara:strand:+ start:111 stop:617 length:507 start_codon:yes stop_codon:yes gene_type:complete